MTRYTAAYETGFLARFTATVASAVPEFDPETNPIGHALAAEIFAPAVEDRAADEPRLVVWPEPAIKARAEALAARPAGSGTAADAVFGDVVELPVGVSEVEWFGATTEPDEEIDVIDEDVRMAG